MLCNMFRYTNSIKLRASYDLEDEFNRHKKQVSENVGYFM